MTAAGTVPESAAQVGHSGSGGARLLCCSACLQAIRERIAIASKPVNCLAALGHCPAVPPTPPLLHLLPVVLQAVLVPSEELPEDALSIRGYDFNQGCDLNGLLESMLRTGLQATSLGQAVNEVNRMVGAGWWVLAGELLLGCCI